MRLNEEFSKIKSYFNVNHLILSLDVCLGFLSDLKDIKFAVAGQLNWL